MVDILKAKAERLGRVPLSYELLQKKIISKYFSSWNKALEEVRMRKIYKPKPTKEELLDIIRAKTKELGRTPLKREISHGGTIVEHFGSWNKALEAAGIDKKYKREYTKEELLDMLKAKAEELGRAPMYTEISESIAIAKYFGSWAKALNAAGIKWEQANTGSRQ